MGNTKSIGIAYSDQDITGGTLTNCTITGAAVTGGAGSFTTLASSGQTTLGDNAADLISFHGASPVDQAAFIATQSINALSVSGIVGFTSSTSLSSFVGKMNSILALLSEKGLMASS